MNLAHKIKLNPTPEQEAYFRQAVGCARFVWNWAVAQWLEGSEQKTHHRQLR
jgi:putative transposase